MFTYNHKKGLKNVETYFYRFEFQEKGTVHLHMLVWLKKLDQIRLNLTKGDIPWSSMKLAKTVAKLQKSDKDYLDEMVQQIGENSSLNPFHPADAFAVNLRLYISTMTPSLKCRMDVQTADGQGMLLKYAASYVSKWHDAFDSDALFSVHEGPYEGGYRYLKDLTPLEPQM